MPSDDQEVFEQIQRSRDTTREVAFLTYAIYAFERSEWIKHFQARSGRLPSSDDLAGWIGNLTDYQFDGMRERAVNIFDEAARAYLREEMEEAEKSALHAEIVASVKAAGAFWKQLAIALVTAILAPILLGAVVAGVLIWEKGAPTAGAVAHLLNPSTDPAIESAGKPGPSPDARGGAKAN